MGNRRRRKHWVSPPVKPSRLCPQCDRESCSGDCYPDLVTWDEYYPVLHRQQKLNKDKDCWEYAELKLPYPLLNARVPSDTEILVFEALKNAEVTSQLHKPHVCGAPYCGACSGKYKPVTFPKTGRQKKKRCEGEDEDNGEDMSAKRLTFNFEALRSSFQRIQKGPLLGMIPGLTRLQPTELGAEVVISFMKTVRRLSCAPGDLTIALHGTSNSNHESICSRGLIIPGHKGVTVAHGSSLGVGIYTSTNFNTSKYYCDGGKILVCALVDDTKNHSNQSKSTCKVQASKNIKHHGEVIVVFNEAHIIPLYIAEFASSAVADPKQTYWYKHGNNNHLAWFSPSLYEAATYGKKLKRERVSKSQARELRYMREIKAVDQCWI